MSYSRAVLVDLQMVNKAIANRLWWEYEENRQLINFTPRMKALRGWFWEAVYPTIRKMESKISVTSHWLNLTCIHSANLSGKLRLFIKVFLLNKNSDIWCICSIRVGTSFYLFFSFNNLAFDSSHCHLGTADRISLDPTVTSVIDVTDCIVLNPFAPIHSQNSLALYQVVGKHPKW